MTKPWEQDWGTPSESNDERNPWERDWGTTEDSDSPKRKNQATAADYIRAIDTGFAQGITGIGAAAGTILQDPGGAIVSGLTGARALADRGLTHLINAADPGAAQFNTEQQRAAQIASEVAADRRAANAADPLNLPARLGRYMEQDSRRVTEEIKAKERADNPELIAQQEEVAKAEGFFDKLGASVGNPLALTNTLARSAPDMAAGVGVGSALKRAGVGMGGVSAAGTAAEAASSGMQAREGTYQQVAGMPLETLAQSPRFNELLQAYGGNAMQAREALANELADQTPVLSALGTAAGTVLTNRLFGGDATAKSIMGVEKMTAREFGKRVAQDTGEEGFQGVPEDTVQHGAVVQADANKKWDPAGSLAENMVAGLAMGSGGHGLAYARENMGRTGPTPAPAPAAAPGLAVDVTYQRPDGQTVTSTGSAGASPSVATADTTEAEKALRTPVTLTALDRANEIDGEVAGITQRLATLTPENGYGPTFDQERQELAAQAAELERERAGIAATWPKAIKGAPTAFSTEAGVKLDGEYALMDAGDLITSHTESLRPNPLYPQELQPRDRSRNASEMQVSGIVQKLDPARLGLSADAGTGAPIVGADGLVESGNARTIAMKRVYQANGQKAADYKQFLRDNAAQFGLAPDAIDALEKPVLVRVRSTPVNRAEFARQANASTVQRMSPSEQALSDAKRLNSLDGLNPTEDGDFSSSNDFIRQFMATLPITEQSDLIESDGRLSTAGYRRIQNAVLARAYGDSPSLRRMTESMDNNLVNVSKALLRVAPTIAAARERMQAGTMHQADIAPDLLAAVEGLSALKEKGWTVAQELAQVDLTGPKYTPEAAELLGFLSDNIRSPRRIAEFFQRYYEALEQAGDPTQPSMFGDDGPAPARADLLSSARGEPTAPAPLPTPAPTAAPAAAFDFDAIEQALTEERAATTNEIEDGWMQGGERRRRTPLEAAIYDAVATATLTAEEAKAIVDVALAAGRLDLAEYAIRRAERAAESMSTTPGVSKDSPKYEAIKKDLERRKAEETARAAALRRVLNERKNQRGTPNDTDQNPERGVNRESAQAAAQDGRQPQDAPGRGRGNQGDGPAAAQAAGGQPSQSQGQAATDAGEWVAFPAESGTLGIPRSDMPQVKGEHRGALINFLKARGIESSQDSVDPSTLKPTQAEFSTKKVAKFTETGAMGERSVLVSSDGYVLDGHHQWMGHQAMGDEVPVIRLDAPIKKLLATVREFPSVQRSDGATAVANDAGDRAQAVTDFKDALADLAQIASKHTRAAMVPENTPELMPTLVKLYDAGIKLLGTDLKILKKWVGEQLKKDARFKIFWNKIGNDIHQKAALQALDQMDAPAQAGLFDSPEAATGALQSDLFAQPPAQPAEPAEPAEPAPDGVALDLDGVVIRHGKGLIKGKFLAEVDGDGVPGGPWDTEQKARTAAEAWKQTTADRATEDAAERARRGRIADKFRAGEVVTNAEIESLGLKTGSSDMRWFMSTAANLFGLNPRDIRPLVKDLIRTSLTDMGAKREFVPTRQALEAIAKSQAEDAPMFSRAPAGGQTETAAFKRWFGDSKVVDAEGNPLVAYHGTIKSFDAFDQNAEPFSYESDRGKQFFLDNPIGASDYAIGTSDAYGGNANVMPVYLRMENPRIEEVDGPPSEWWDENGDGLYWELDVSGSGHDGLIVRGDGETMYVTANPNQIKSATGNRGAFDPDNADIRFSRGVATEVRNLVTLHNLTDENLRFADSMGGIPVPSIGITKVESPFGGFGNITLIAPKWMIDPKAGVPVYDRDAWTARFPTMNFKKVKAKMADAFYERMKPVRELMAGDDDGFISQLWEQLRNASVQSPEKITSIFTRYDAGRVMYAKEVLGKTIKVPMRNVRPATPVGHDAQLLAYWKKHGAALILAEREMSGAEFSNTPENKAFEEEVQAAIRRYADAAGAPEIAKGFIKQMMPDGTMGAGTRDRLIRDFKTYGTKEVDRIKLGEAVNKAVKRDDPAYLRWVESLVKPLFDEPTITLRGREVAPTLDNIVDAMTVGATAGAEKSMTFSPGKVAAMLGKQFKSLDEIKAARDQVVSAQAETEGKKATDALLDGYRTHVSQFYGGKDWRGNIDTWAANDDSMEALAKAGKLPPSDASIRATLARMNFKGVDQRAVDMAREAIAALRNAATDYFEAKPQRAVTLDEFKGAVVPKGTSAETMAILEKHGIAVEVHNKTEGAREKAIQKLAKRLDRQSGDVLFTRSTDPSDPYQHKLQAIQAARKQAADVVQADNGQWLLAPKAEPYTAQEARDAQQRIDKLNRALGKYSNVAPAAVLSDAPTAAMAWGRSVARTIGYDVTFIQPNPDFHGVAVGGDAFVSASAEHPEIGLIGHEVLHSFKQSDPDTYEALAERIRPYLKNGVVDAKRKWEDARGGQNTSMAMAEEEVFADLNGAMWLDPLFWREMASNDPSLFRQVAYKFMEVATKAMKGLSRFKADALVTDVDAVRKIIAQEWATQAQEMGNPSEFSETDGPAFSRATATDTKAFRDWFKDSKVVDADGNPLVVYHGTGRDFSIFDAAAQSSHIPLPGFYFSPDPDIASGFAESAAKLDENRAGRAFLPIGANVVPAYLSLQNPAEIDASKTAHGGRMPSESVIEELLIGARKAGHDGAIIRGWSDGSGPVQYVAFRPEQIKSATGNRGNFDPADPDIRFSRTSAATGMPVAELRALAEAIAAQHPRMPKVHVLADPGQAPQALRAYIEQQGAMADVEGAYHRGELYLFASTMQDAARAEHVLAAHEAAHFGLRAILAPKELKTALRMIWVSNAKVRKAATELQRRGKLTETEATEEVIVDIPSAELARLKGWRKVVQAVADYLGRRGYSQLQESLAGWLAGTLSEQQRADLFVADLVRAARAYVQGQRPGLPRGLGSTTRLSGSLAEDLEKQEQWLSKEARARGYKDIDTLVDQDYPLFERLAKLWREKNPAENGVLLSRGWLPLVSARSEIEAAIREAGAALQQAIKAGRADKPMSLGRPPHALAMLHANPLPLVLDANVQTKVFFGKHQAEMAGVTGEMLVRAIYRPAMVVEDLSDPGTYQLVTNILTKDGPVVVSVKSDGRWSGGRASVVQSAYPRNDGRVADWLNGKDAKRNVLYVDEAQIAEAVTGRLDPRNANPTFKGWDLVSAKETINTVELNARAATASISDKPIIAPFGAPINAHYRGLSSVAVKLQQRLSGNGMPKVKTRVNLMPWIDKYYKGDAADKPMFSRAPVAKTAIERAEAIIQDQAGGTAPLDALARMLTRATGVERLTGAIYDKAAQLLDRYTPERVKAGIVSDYGVPEAVIDQRTLLQARQRVQLRKAGELVEKLATLTRAESRVAYEWMNMEGDNPQAYVSMMQGLPEESVKVLQDVQKMIDQLSQEAVRMGQLDADAFARNRFAYLRRSYAKHTLEQTAGQKAKRSRTIAVLGEQYKGRGLSESAPMDKIKAVAPDWWGRKLAKGKADAALKGEKFLRLEYRTHKQSGAAVRVTLSGKGKPYYITRSVPLNTKTGQFPGLEVAAHETKLREVVYWPAGEKIPAQYSEWDQAGTWEVRDVKGPNAIFWRDFTKDERESMGEIDEARFAIAKTLHAMIHDVEVGRYLEWLAARHAKKEGETIPGTVVEASERMRDTFAPGEWVRVPDSKIQGTNVLKYGKLAGRYLPGPVWNDLRQVVGGQFQPFGETYSKILSLWKTSKTALSPAVHMNNVMSNFVMADWHDVHATQVGKALRILLAASQKPGGMADREAAVEILNRYKDSGGDAGSWVTQEISREQIEPLLESLQNELAATNGQSMAAQTGIFAALQHAMQLRFPEAWDAAKAGRGGKTVAAAGGALIDLYQSEDDVFRLAAWLAAKERGATDMEAGKLARKSFLDYNINAPWINAMRKSAWPFLSFTYRAVPMLLETAAKKPHKLMKLMALAGALNALGVMLAGGGGDDDERKMLPEEKAGGIWGMVPKLIRMPWNDANGSPVYLDIRRWVPVGDVLDVGQGHAAVPILPGLMPGGPLVLMGEVVLNRSAFTGKPITLETDTPTQQAAKLGDYLYKSFAPNILGLPNTYATEGVVGSMTGRTDAFGREMSTAQAVASSFGVKVGSYPADVMRRNLTAATLAQTSEIDKNISQLKRQLQTGRIDQAEFQDLAKVEQEKKVKLMQKLAEKTR